MRWLLAEASGHKIWGGCETDSDFIVLQLQINDKSKKIQKNIYRPVIIFIILSLTSSIMV